MAGQITPNSTAVAADFIKESEKNATASVDNGRVVKLENVDGDDAKLAKVFLPNDTVYTTDVPSQLNRFDGVGEKTNFSFINDTLQLNSTLWTAYIAHTISTFGEDYGVVTPATEAGSGRQVGQYKTLTFASDVAVEMGVQLTGSTGDEPPAWGIGNSIESISNGISKDAGPEGSAHQAVGFREDAGTLKVRTVNGSSFTETTITGITLTNTNRYRIEFEAGVEARFYVNGVLKATIITNLPTTGSVYIGYGYRGSTGGHGMRISAPRVSY